MMLKKDFSKRPDIEEVIYTDAFQTKAQKLGMTLPLALNKKKLQHQYSIGKLDIDLTDKQRRLAGIGVKVVEKKVPSLLKPSENSMLKKNFSKNLLVLDKDKKETASKLPGLKPINQSAPVPKDKSKVLKTSNTASNLKSVGKEPSIESKQSNFKSRFVNGRQSTAIVT